MSVRNGALLVGLVCASLALVESAPAGDRPGADQVGEPGQKLAPPAKPRVPRYQAELVKNQAQEIAEARQKLRDLGEKLTNASLNFTQRQELQHEMTTAGEHLKGLLAQVAAQDADEAARAKADRLAGKASRKKAGERGGQSRRGDAPEAAAPASPKPESEPAPSPSR